MNKNLLALLLLIATLGYSQTQGVNRDSIAWENENPHWEKTIFESPEFVNKLEVSMSDHSIHLYMSMQKECRIFGYQKPDKKSKRMLLLSIWTFDVKDNPCHCPLGSYYETGNLDGIDLKYIKTVNSFIEAAVFQKDKQVGIVYFEKKWVRFVN